MCHARLRTWCQSDGALAQLALGSHSTAQQPSDFNGLVLHTLSRLPLAGPLCCLGRWIFSSVHLLKGSWPTYPASLYFIVASISQSEMRCTGICNACYPLFLHWLGGIMCRACCVLCASVPFGGRETASDLGNALTIGSTPSHSSSLPFDTSCLSIGNGLLQYTITYVPHGTNWKCMRLGVYLPF